MAKNTLTTFSQTPYVDDFHVTDPNTGKTPEEKNYLRILYKPGVSVQARELNQMQSTIQSQIDQFGRGVFSEGASIIEGEKNFDDDVYAIDVEFDAPPGTALDDLSIIADKIEGIGLKASILETLKIGEKSYRLFIKYENSVQESGVNVKEFETGAIYATSNVTYEDGSIWVNSGARLGEIDDIKYAAIATVEPGVFFVKGQFVLGEYQEIYIVKPTYDYLISGKVAFQVNESVKTSGDDNTLLDNASGEPNYAAPGADRYAIDLKLVFVSDDDGDTTAEDGDATFILDNSDVISSTVAEASSEAYSPLIIIVNNNVQEKSQTLFADNIEATLARRTSEESGDYAVKPFGIDIRDFLNDEDDGENRGLYSTDQMRTFDIDVEEDDISGIANNGPITIDSTTTEDDVEEYGKSRFIVGVEPSIAYVEGFRIDPQSRIDVPVERARTTESNTEIYTTARLGNYLEGETIDGLPTFGESVTFNSDTSPAGSTTAKIRGLENIGGKYRLYLYDINGTIDLTATTATGGTSGFVFNFTADSGLNDTEYTRSLYELPYDNVSDVGETEIAIRRKMTYEVADAGVITLTDTSDNRFFDENENSYIVAKANNAIIEIQSALIGGTNNDTITLTATTATDLPDGATGTVLLSQKKTLVAKQKYSATRSTQITGLTNTFVNLSNTDVVKITGATYLQDPTNPQNTDTFPLLLADLVLDDGQRDGVYKTSSVRYKGTPIPLDSNSAERVVTVTYDCFLHQVTGDYYNKNSYPGEYADIPSYGDIRLSDVLDFRPDDGSYNTTPVDPNSVIESIISFYLNRIDKVVVNNVGDFDVISGIPAIDPVEPETPDSTMHLYTIEIPAYTFDVKDINSQYVDNRRYTMRDIGEIEQRLTNLEYYTSLSLLEREADGKQIFDTTSGNPYERFKNGILVDSFTGHSVGDVDDEGYLCSIDKEEGVLRPSFEQSSTRLLLNDPDNNSYGSLATLDYQEEVPFIQQLKASTHMSVNPYAVAAWWGEVKLSPSSDEWKETSQRPDIVINKENDADVLRAISDATKAQGTVWNSWRTNWTGRSRWGWGRRRSRRWGRRGRWWRRRRSGTIARQARVGVRSTMSIETVRSVVNEKVIDTSIVPFIRSRRVYFSGKMFRPNTKLYVYFDSVDISSYATKAPFQEFSTSNDVKSFLSQTPTQIFSGTNNREEVVTDDNGNIEGYFVIPNNAATKFRTGEREVIFTDNEVNDSTQATTTANASYSASGIIEHMQKTVVSTRQVKVSQERVTQSRNLWRWNRWRSRRRGRWWTRRRGRGRRRRWRDPLAQSFMIGEIETGLYATSLDLYFYKKSTNVPVQMYVVTMDNGYPTQEIVPLSEVTLLPDAVAVSDDASVPTNFMFESPVYLQAGVEYAIVVLSNDDAYRMWLSEIGKDDVKTGEFIAKNPYTGVMFKSQNASTWTADQNKDFKFTFNRAKFEENTKKEIIFNTLGICTEEEAILEEGNGPLEFSQLTFISESVSIPLTTINYQMSVDSGATYFNVTTGEDIYKSSVNAVEDDTTIILKAILSSESEFITPVIDLERISLVGVKNFVNSEAELLEDNSPLGEDEDSELSSIHGYAFARYLTQEVELNNPADQLNVYLNINRPIEQSNVKVYVRFNTGEESIKNSDFEEITPDTVIPITSIREDYSEVLFSVNKEDQLDTTNSLNFTSFQVKIVMVSNDHAYVPVMKDFRAIATT